jgi:hypothetical protein
MEGIFANEQMEAVLLQPGETELPVNFPEPPGLVRMQVCAMTGMRPNEADTDLVSEVFIAGTEPQQVCDVHKLFNVCLESPEPALANAFCPPSSVIQRPYVVLPPIFKDWERTLAKPLGPPTAYCCASPTPEPSATPVPQITETPVPGLAPPIKIPYPTARPTPPLDDEFPGAQVSLTSPRPGVGVGGEVTITGSAAADDFDYYKVGYGQGTDPSAWVAINGQVTTPVRGGILAVWNTNDLPEGSYTLRLTLVGKAGQVRRYNVPVVIERSKPKVRLASPATGARFTAGDPVTLIADVSAPQGLAGVEFYVDKVRVAVAYNPPYQYVWTARPGEHSLDAIAYSPYGRTATSDPVTIVVQERPTPTPTARPTFQFVFPQDGATFTGPALPLVVSASSESVQIDHVDFYVDGWAIGSIKSTDTFQTTWQTITGRHTLMAIAYTADNQEVARTQITVYTGTGP